MMSTVGQKETKLAPIFSPNTNKSKGSDRSDDNKRKRKKKSSKNENKINKLFDKTSAESESNHEIDCRRSKRIRSKVSESEHNICYNEDTDEEVVCDTKLENSVQIVDNLNESVVLIEESSDTIDYWTDHKSEQIDIDEDIEILPTETKLSSQTSKQTISSSSQSESLLWTERYKPTNSSEVIGHKLAVNELKKWLKDWGKCDSKRDMSDSGDDSNYLDQTTACLLICGPTGSGKTSLVYAIAEELKYEILELNASTKRNGRIITKILSEATQSHQMQRNNDSNGTTPSIQSFFNSVSNNFVNKPVINGKKKAKPKGILNYFSKEIKKVSSNCDEIEVIDDKVVERTQPKSDSVLELNDRTSNDSLIAPKALSIATNSLILFDDIDVLIDEDITGFWGAFNRICETTKKPVILTATQYVPHIKDCVNQLQVLTLNKPNPSETIDGLKRICDKEFKCNEISEEVCKQVSTTYDYDIRRCLNQLQFDLIWDDNDSQTEVLTDNKLDMTSVYDSLLFVDVMETQFGIQSYPQNRDNWMKCKPLIIENESQSITLAKDMVESIDQMIYNTSKRSFKSKELSKPIDTETIESISSYLSPYISLRTLFMDYCPYLSFICESESIKYSKLDRRRSRRFMHHLKSIGFYIDDGVKTKLISAFISHETDNDLKTTSIEPDSGSKMDDYLYE